jgi:hypothetical protein
MHVAVGMQPPRCRGCGERLTGAYLVSPTDGGGYHPACLACQLCRRPCDAFVPVPSQPDLLCCRQCHDHTFAEKCEGCQKPLDGAVVAAMGKRWHRCTPLHRIRNQRPETLNPKPYS